MTFVLRTHSLACRARVRVPLLGALLHLVLSMAPASAATFYPASLEDLCRSAHAVVRAECVSTETLMRAERGRAYTYTTFRVLENLSGTSSETIVLRVVSLGETVARSLGIPSFKPGDREVLFLTAPNDDGYPFLVGIGMGCYHVRGASVLQHMPVPRPAAGSGVSGQAVRTFLPRTSLTTLEAAIRSVTP